MKGAEYFDLRTANCVVCLLPLPGAPFTCSGHVLSDEGKRVTASFCSGGECADAVEARKDWRGRTGCLGPWKVRHGVVLAHVQECPAKEETA